MTGDIKIINLDKDLLRGTRPFNLKFPLDNKYENEDTFNAPSTGNIHKVWVAGGAIRNWLMNEKNIDIDVFFNNRDSLNEFKSLNTLNDAPAYVSNYCEAYTKDNQHIQLITKFFDNIGDMFNYFDYTLCQFAFDGQDLYTTEQAFINTTNKQLCVNNIQKNCELSSLNRAFKYASYGYNIEANTLRNIAKSFVGLNENDIKGQHIEYPDYEGNEGIIKI